MSARTTPSFADGAQRCADALQAAWLQVAQDPDVLASWGTALAAHGRAVQEGRRFWSAWLHACGLPTLDDLRTPTGEETTRDR